MTALTRWRILCFAAPGMPAAMMLYAIGVVIPGYYVSVVGLSASAVGTVLLVTRLGDVVFDFAVGFITDVTRTRFGRRKPWILAGGIIVALTSWIILTPAAGAGAEFFLLSLLGFYFGWSLLTVPYDAWGSELARDYATRSRVFTYRVASGYIGSLLFSILPILPFFHGSDFSPEVMAFAAGAAGLLLLITIPLALGAVPQEPPATPRKPDIIGLIGALRRNRPLRLYIVAAILTGLSNGMFAAVVYIYETDYMPFGDRFWLMLIVYLCANFLALPLWTPFVRRLGKHRAWALGLALNSLCYPPMAFLAPEAASFLPTLILIALAGATYSVVNVAMPAVLGDVVDYDTLKSGVTRAGNLFALQALITKFNLAVGAGFAFLLIGWSGFVTGGGPQTVMGILGIQTAFPFLPSLLTLVAIPFVWYFPLTEKTQATIRRRLDRIALRKPATLPV